MIRTFVLLSICGAAWAQLAVDVVRVESRAAAAKTPLPGEIAPYETVDLRARVTGFVERVNCDTGSVVRKGQLLVELSAPELGAQLAQAQSQIETAEARRAEAEARLAAAELTHASLRDAAATPGAIARTEIELAAKSVDAAKAALGASQRSVESERARRKSLEELASFLSIRAPFDGVITRRMAHPGTLAGPGEPPLLRLEHVQRLRLAVAVPETLAGSVRLGTAVSFTVPAYPGQNFQGVVARNPAVVDPQTRTMPVELDIANADRRLSPGMYPEVRWPSRRPSGFAVPASAVVTTTERVFVIRVRGAIAEWVDVRKVGPAGDRLEVQGALAEGDVVVARATDEIRPGARVQPK